MNKSFKAHIIWLTKEQGGRDHLPFGNKYAPIIKITKPSMSSNDFWSIFVVNNIIVNQNQTVSEIEYLSKDAPNNLNAGVEFALYEGPNLVATGVVLEQIKRSYKIL